jgi:hypothetical protein
MKTRTSNRTAASRVAAALAVFLGLVAPCLEAFGRPPPPRAAPRPPPPRTSVNHHAQVNHNVNVHRSVHVDVDRGYPGYHPVARATTAVAAAVVVGSIVHSLPPACSAVVVNGLTYQQCGSAWYQPRYAGTQVTYMVVNPPR